jgi:hypothetical protein
LRKQDGRADGIHSELTTWSLSPFFTRVAFYGFGLIEEREERENEERERVPRWIFLISPTQNIPIGPNADG